ncbi:lower collar protein [Curtobacterium phage Pize]|uniref:lower collar protein n=1 Tax=Curtobacterium phage Pize TaxID=2851068 RepID=UPI00220C9CF6|nr:lower collar protein [Curtobacterium phage Pize]QXG07741.1 lower collar protein [Curtobacterium phage Pize]
MATFTMRLKDVVRRVKADVPAGTGLGLDTYPVFNADYRAGLNQKIVDHFWNQEIGLESIELWRFNMRRKMNEIMPLYNKLYESERIKFDPLSTMDMKTVSGDTSSADNKSDSSTESTGNSTGDGITVNSDFPQTALNDNDTGNYASSSTESNSKGDTKSNGKESRTDKTSSKSDSTSATTGYAGVAADLLMRYRATLLNIDMMVIGELQELFMSIWDNGDTFTESGFNA